MVTTRSMRSAVKQESGLVKKSPYVDYDDSCSTDSTTAQDDRDSEYQNEEEEDDMEMNTQDERERYSTVSVTTEACGIRATPRRAVLAWLRAIRQAGTYRITDMSQRRVGVCFLCNKVKTLSKEIEFSGRQLRCGRNCAHRITLACPLQASRRTRHV